MLEPNKDLEEIFEKAVQVASVNSHEYVTLEHFLFSMLNDISDALFRRFVVVSRRVASQCSLLMRRPRMTTQQARRSRCPCTH